MRIRRYLDPRIELVPLDPPGHGQRFEESLVPSYELMADDLFSRCRDIVNDYGDKLAFFGHSMGASLALLVTRRLAREGLPLPSHLFVSGSAGPAVSPRFRGMYRLADDRFLEALRTLGGIRDEHLSAKGLLDLFLPVLRSDLKAASDFELDTDQEPLEVPVSVFLGRDDLITRDEPLRWNEFTRAPTALKSYPGGHFFFLDHLEDIASTISNTLKLL
jgi:surfactin synthase thioesterase subunit